MAPHDAHGNHAEDHRYHCSAAALRSAERLALLEVERVVDLYLDGGSVSVVLDVGTGSGVFAEAFAGRGLHVTGVDLNPDMAPCSWIWSSGA